MTPVEEATDRARDALLHSSLSGTHPYPYEPAVWLAGRHTAFLTDSMGLGKVVQALIAIPTGCPVLVVCPAALKPLWVEETVDRRPDLKVTVIRNRRKFKMPERGEMCIVSYTALPQFEYEDQIHASPWTILIGAEGQALKNGKAKQTKSFKKISNVVGKSNGRSWLLCSGPLKPPELWSCLEAAGCAFEAFGSWRNFVDLFNGCKHSRYSFYIWGKPKPKALELLKKVMWTSKPPWDAPKQLALQV